MFLYRVGKKIWANYCFHWVHFYKFLSQTSSFQKYFLYVWWVSWLDVPLVSPLTHLDYEISTPGLFTSWCFGLKWKTFTHGLFGSQHWILSTGQLPTLNRLCLHLSFWLFFMFWPAISPQPCCLFTQIKLKIPLFFVLLNWLTALFFFFFLFRQCWTSQQQSAVTLPPKWKRRQLLLYVNL